MIAYLTDIEGQWEKLRAFADSSGCVRIDEGGAIQVDRGCVFVFGGDAIDRGPSSRRIVRALLDARLRQPERVVLIAGNRDINKMRLVRELAGAPIAKLPPELRGGAPSALLQGIFAHTMGARAAFEHRRAELIAEGRGADDALVTESFLEDLAPQGDLTRYLAAAQLGYFEDATLIVHGAVTEENLGVVPGVADRIDGTRAWVDELNAFYARELGAWRASLEAPPELDAERWAGRAIVDYQCPIPATKLNQASVVYGRPTDEENNPWLPPRAVVERLRRDGVERLLVGHTPSGDAPALLRDEGFAFVMADNSYGRIETGSRVLIDGSRLSLGGVTRLDDGRTVEVRAELRDGSDEPLIGRRDAATGELVKAQLATGEYLLFKALPDNQALQVAASASALRGRTLVAPYRD